jgi:hypothetical protein
MGSYYPHRWTSFSKDDDDWESDDDLPIKKRHRMSGGSYKCSQVKHKGSRVSFCTV